MGWPDNLWLKNGYAVAIDSVRGTGCSQGVFDLFGRHEGPDGAAIIHWIGAQPWSDRRVGMIGHSYPGFTQILVAAQHPKLLRVITPSAIAAHAYSQIVYPGGIFNAAFIAWWSLHGQPLAAAQGVKTRIGWGTSNARATTGRIRPPRCSFRPVPIGFSLTGGRRARFRKTSVGSTSRPSYRAPGKTR